MIGIYRIKNIVNGKEYIVYTKEEMKESYAKSHRGKKNVHNKPILIDEIEYRTLDEASNALGIHRMTIKQRILSKNEKFSNYKYKII